MTTGGWEWIADALTERLGRPIVDTEKMVGFELQDGRQIALQKDVKSGRLWVEHDEGAGWPPATVIRKYAADESRHSNLPSRLRLASSSSASRKVIVVSVAGPHMLDGVLAWYGASDRFREPKSVRSFGAVVDDGSKSVRPEGQNSNAAQHSHSEGRKVAELTLVQLVEEADASVRVTNCVKRSSLRQMTVSAARANPEEVVRICMAVPSMGRKSINELQQLLNRAPVNPDCSWSISTEVEPSSDFRPDVRTSITEQFRRVFGGLRVEWLIHSRGGSVRLLNGLSEQSVKNMMLGDLLVDWHALKPSLHRLKNLGKKSVSELRELCTATVMDLLTACELPQQQANNILLIISGGTKVTAGAASDSLLALEQLKAFDVEDLRSKSVTDLQDIVQTLFGLLDERANDVVNRRTGCGGHGVETLEEIAQGYGVTRERIRQIEAKALTKMCAAAGRYPLQEALVGEARKLWRQLSEEKGYVALRDLATLSVPPGFRLGLKLADRQLSDILDIVAVRWRTGWHQFERTQVELDDICHTLSGLLAGLQLPRPMPSNLDPASRMVVDLGLGMRYILGYALSPAGTARSQTRLIDLHRAVGDPTSPVEILSLASRAAFLWGESSVSARYLSLILSRHPHLFIEAAGDNWFVIGLPADYAPVFENEAAEHRIENVEKPDGSTMAGFLHSLLEETGPLRLSVLMERAALGLGDGRSISSIGPTLLMHKELFERYLPGVYGLKGQALESHSLLDAQPSYLLNDEQARLFALGRRAGVAWGTFPMWTPSAEFALCGWALEAGSDAILGALLSTASIDLWPVGNGEKTFWKDRLARSGSTFALHFEPREQVGYSLPPLDRLFAACLEARASRGFNWITANLVLNRTVGSHVAAGLLALMCSLETLTCEGNHWQLPHHVGPKLEEVIGLLACQLHDHGSLTWRSEAGSAVLASAAQALTRSHTWVDRHLFAVMLDQANTADAANGSHDFQSQVVQTAIDELMWEGEDIAGPALAEARNALESDYAAIRISAARVLSDEEADWSLGSVDDEGTLG